MIRILDKYKDRMAVFRLFIVPFLILLSSFILMSSAMATTLEEKKEDGKPFITAEGRGLEMGAIGNTIGFVYKDTVNNWDNEIRKFITATGGETFDWKQNGSATTLTLPLGAKIVKAVLLYGGTAMSHSFTAWHWNGKAWSISEASLPEGFTSDEIKNAPIRLTTPSGITHSLSYNSELGKRHVKYREVDRHKALKKRGTDGSFSPDPVYYMVSIDVTEELRASGSGRYSVEGIPTRIAPSLSATNAGGWSIYYIYEDPTNNNMRRASLYTGLAEVEKNWSDEPAGKITINDFETPDSGVINGKIILSALEGDSGLRATGDMVRLWIGSSEAEANTNGRAKYLSTPYNLEKNFFNGIIISNDGNIDTAGTRGTANNTPGVDPKEGNRYGWDIAQVSLNGLLKPGDKFLRLGLYSIGESYAVHGIGFSFDIGQADLQIKKEADKKEAAPGDVVNFTITVENKGGKDTTTSAKEVEVTDYFDPDVFEYDENKGKSLNLLSYDNNTGKCVWKMPKPIQRGEKVSIILPLVVKEATKDTETENVAVVTSPNYVPPSDPTDPNDPSHVTPPDPNTPPTVTIDVGKKKHKIPKKSKISNKVPVTINHVDLAITKDVLKEDNTPLEKDKDGIPLVNPNQTVTYKITVKNDGKRKANKVNVKDLFPKGFTVDDTKPDGGIKPSKGTVDRDPDGNYVWNIGPLEPNGAEEVNLELKVKIPPDTDGIYPSNSITTPEGQLDINERNNEASVTVKTRGADLEIKKTASEHSPDIGETFTYAIEVENHGPNKAEKIIVQDILNEHLEYLGASRGANVTFDNATRTFTWKIDALEDGQKTALEMQVKVKDTLKNEDSYGIENEATVSTEPGGSKDPNPKNNKSKVAPKADLGLTKIVDYDATAPGKDLIYTLTAHNFGPDRALLAKVSDTLPANVEYVGVVGKAPKGTVTYDKNTRTITWLIGNMQKDETQYVRVKVAISKDATGEIENHATITSKTPEPKPNPDPNVPPAPKPPAPSPDPNNPVGPTPPVDPKNPNGNNNPPPTITRLYSPADVEIQKEVDKKEAKDGDELTYTLKAINNSDIATARNVKVIDKLPLDLTFSKFVGEKPTDKYDPKTGEWSIGDMLPKEVRTLKITAKIKDNTSDRKDDIRNFAEITTDSPDPKTPNNRSKIVITAFKDTDMEVKIERSRMAHPPTLGDTFTYIVTIKNNSPTPAPDVTVTDDLPPEVEVIGVETPPNTAYNPTTHLWKVDGIVKKEDPPRVMKLKVRVKKPPLKAMIATVRVRTSLKDTVRENDVDSTGGSADLVLTKEVDKTVVTPKGTLIYTITIQNNGPDDSKGVLVKDVLPGDAKYISQKSTQGHYDDYYGEWSVGDLKNGQKAVLEIETDVVRDEEGDITNKATIIPTVTDDPNPKNNGGEVKTTVKKSKYDVAVVKTIDEPNKNNFYYDTKDDKPRDHQVGDKVISYIEAWNLSEEDVKDVTVLDLPDPSMKILSGEVEGNVGSFNPKTGVWSIPELKVGQKLRLKVLLELGKGASGIVKNTATVSLPEGKLDQNPKNNRSVGKLAVGGADLEIKKTSFNPNPTAERPDIEFTITAINHGPLDATDVVMTEEWPAGLEYVKDGSDPAYDHEKRTWDIGIIKNGKSKSIKIHARWRGDDTKSTLNKVTIKGKEIDPNPKNDHSDAGGISDLVTTEKVTDKHNNPINRVKVGDELFYKVTVENKGKDTAFKSILKSKIPDTLELISFELPRLTPDNPPSTYDKETGIVTLGKLKHNDKVTIIFRTRVKENARGSIEHNSHADTVTMEKRKDNNDYKTSIIVGEDSKVFLEKRALRTEVRRGETVPYEITITNTSLVKLENVVLEDIIPPGFAYVEDSARVQIGENASPRGIDLADTMPLSFVIPEIPANDKTKVTYVLRAGAAVNPGIATNRALAKKNKIPLTNEGTAQIRILEEPLFDHTLIYGHVYEDINRNGSMDKGEPGISGVKLATVTGLIVTTDRVGRYHIAGEWGGSWDRGRNFILKLDPFSLPQHSIVFTENPRTVRLSPGVPTKINFGIVYEEATSNSESTSSTESMSRDERAMMTESTSNNETVTSRTRQK